MQAMQVTYADFEKIEMRVGKVIRAEPFPGPGNRLIDCGSTLAHWGFAKAVPKLPSCTNRKI